MKEEGVYNLKRVDNLPKNGNANLLYALKSPTINTVYRWTNGSYEELSIGSLQSIVAGTNVTIDITDPQNPIINAAAGGGGLLETVHIQLSAAQILTLNSIPVEVIPAPGVGKYVEVLAASFFLDYGGVQFDVFGTTNIGISGSASFISNLVNDVNDVKRSFASSVNGALWAENAAILVWNNADNTVGNSTVDLYVTYVVIDT